MVKGEMGTAASVSLCMGICLLDVAQRWNHRLRVAYRGAGYSGWSRWHACM